MELDQLRLTLDLVADAGFLHRQQAGDAQTEEEKIDGIPINFIGPLLADLVARVGHTLGLHNFKASSIYSLEEIAR